MAVLTVVLSIDAVILPQESWAQVSVSGVRDPDGDDSAATPDPFPFIKSEPQGSGARVSSRLRHLVKEVATRGGTREALRSIRPSALSSPLRKVTDDGMVQCYVAYQADPAVVAGAVEAVGGVVELVSGPLGVVQARIPYDQMDTLAGNAEVKRVSLPAYRRVRAGSVTTEGNSVHRCSSARTAWGLTGAGIKVGVISDGISGITRSQASGDIPATYEVRSARADSDTRAGSEGLALMEIIYDLAPGASLAFSNPGTSAEMVNAIDILDSTFHCNVMVDDLGFADEPFFEDGPLVTRINQAVSNGAIYCCAAGNDADHNFYEGNYTGITQRIGGQSMNVQDFSGSGDWGLQASVPGHGGYVTVVLQWNDPWGASANDYDLYLTDSTGNTIYGSSTDTQSGTGDPMEIAEYTNSKFRSGNVYIVVRQHSGVARYLEIGVWGDGELTEHYVTAGSVYGHAAATSVMACGAVSADLPNIIESFSGRGPSRIDFPSLVYRNKPDVCGVDGVMVTGNGGFTTPFYGTSASAAHVAGVCALVWSHDTTMTNSQVRNLVQTTAVDLGTTGYDTTYGYGRADAYNAASTFERCRAAVTVSASPSGGGTVAGGGSYSCGSTVTVTATPSTGYAFVNWTENGMQVSTSSTYTFTIVADRTFVAVFSREQEQVATPTISPNGGTFTDSVEVTLGCATADATITYTTDGSVPAASSTTYSGPFTLTASATVTTKAFADGLSDSDVATASFTITSVATYTLTIQAAGSPTTTQTYAAGTSVTVYAPSAPSGDCFSGWSGDATGTDNPIVVVMDRDRSITANYSDCSSSPSSYAMPSLCGSGIALYATGIMAVLGLMRVQSRSGKNGLAPWGRSKNE